MSRFRRLWVLATALFLGVALLAPAQAQRPGGRQKPNQEGPGAGRPRMRVGGMMGRFGGGNLAGLLRLEQVRNDLKLTDDQTAQLKEVNEGLQAEMREQFAGLLEIEDREKRREKMAELVKQRNEKVHDKLTKVLSQEQMIRLYQIRLNIIGVLEGLSNEHVAGKLKLTAQQKEKLDGVRRKVQATRREMFQGMRGASREERREQREKMRDKFRKLQDDANEQALAVLTKDQKAEYEKLKGEKFELDMSALRMGPRGGGSTRPARP